MEKKISFTISNELILVLILVFITSLFVYREYTHELKETQLKKEMLKQAERANNLETELEHIEFEKNHKFIENAYSQLIVK